MRPRYYCDYCNKGSGSPSYMARHERGCTMNPDRVCGMCAVMERVTGKKSHGLPTVSLAAILVGDGFDAVTAAAHKCPACILAAIRASQVQPSSDWSFAEAKEAHWRMVREYESALQ